jgi:hypothetical protein
MAAVTPVHRTNDFLLYTVDNVFGVVIGRELTLEDVKAIDTCSVDIVRATGARGYSVYIYYAAGLSIPSAEVRQATAKLTQDASDVKLLARALVLPGSGFWASAIQGIYTATTAVVPGRIPQRFCSDDAEAAAFLAPHTTTSVSELSQAFESARRSALPRLRFSPT